MNFLKKFLKGFAFYLSICGMFGFALFIEEEAFQTVMFSVWQSVDCKDWKTVKEAIVIMESFQRQIDGINYVGGWLNPLCFISYSAYSKAEGHYIKALKVKTFANAPELFIGEKINFTFQPKTVERYRDKWALINGRLSVISSEPSTDQIEVTGKLTRDGERLVVENRQ